MELHEKRAVLRAKFIQALRESDKPSLDFWARTIQEGRQTIQNFPRVRGFVVTNIVESLEAYGKKIGIMDGVNLMILYMRAYVEAYNGDEEAAFNAMSEDVSCVAGQRGVTASSARAGCAGVIVLAALVTTAVASITGWVVA